MKNDETKCPKWIYGSSSFTGHQCRKQVWKDGFCKIHHPENVKKRAEESQKRWREQYEKSPYHQLEKALDRIKELEVEVERLKNMTKKEVK